MRTSTAAVYAYAKNAYTCTAGPHQLALEDFASGASGAIIGGGLFIAEGPMSWGEAQEQYRGHVRNNTARLKDENVYVISDSAKGCPLGYYSKDGSGWCDLCPAGQYWVNITKEQEDKEEQVCKPCDESRENCTLGGAAMVPKPYFWHATASAGENYTDCKLDQVIR
jgi:hypothetical protein